jgi:signal transduction histidine kinase
MARDLHDTTGQELAVILMSLGRLANGLGNPRFDAKEELTETTALVRKVENDIRALSYLLHPPMLDELGLKSALGWFVETFSKRSKIQVELQIEESLPRLSRDKEIALFRVVQESLANVVRHSDGATAQIRAETQDGNLRLYVQDAADGFAPGLSRPGNSEEILPGVGILGMRERLQQLGGELAIESTARGTQVRASVPLAGDGAEATVEVSAGETPAPFRQP